MYMILDIIMTKAKINLIFINRLHIYPCKGGLQHEILFNMIDSSAEHVKFENW